jgi:transposase-like protein
MIDFPIDELLDEQASLAWLERHLHPQGLCCPRCGQTDRRLARRGTFPGYRCKDCDRYYTVLTNTAFAKTRQRPAKLVLLLRGIAKGEPTARLARELSLSRNRMHILRQRVQTKLAQSTPRQRLQESAFETDELYQNAGGKKRAPSRSS